MAAEGNPDAEAPSYPGAPPHGNAYNIFILVLTIFSLFVMVAMILPINDANIKLLVFYDNAICAVFLIDFFVNLSRAKSKRYYLFKQGGWLDLVGSIPALAVPRAARFVALFRLARISRMARILRLLRGKNRGALVRDILLHRSQYAGFLTVLIAVVVLLVSSVTVLNAEGRSDDANITSGGDALWWSFVTITTVGYGDQFPVTGMGRISAVFVMVLGIGIIGALASILSSVLTGDGSPPDAEPPAAAPDVDRQLSALTAEVASLRALVEQLDRRLAPGDVPTPREENPPA